MKYIWLIILLWLPSALGEDVSRQFANWNECFRYMAEQVNFPTDDSSLFRLAAESSADWFWLKEGTKETVIVIKLNAISGPYSALRGAQDNGLYCLFTPNEHGFRHVGNMEGNGYKWGTINGTARFRSNWHMSASQSYENIYDWNGTNFTQTSHILYRYEPDGTRQPVEERAEQGGPGYPPQSVGSPDP